LLLTQQLFLPFLLLSLLLLVVVVLMLDYVGAFRNIV
jgi:hypothetical protein